MSQPTNSGEPFGNPYAGTPPTDGAPQGHYDTPVSYEPVAPPAKKRGVGRIVSTVVGVLVAVGVAAGWAAFKAKDDPANAKVGNCVNSAQLNSTETKEVSGVKVVDCSDSSATYKVVGIVNGKSKADFDTDNKVCSQFPSATSALWQGTDSDSSGTVLCLEPAKK